MALADRVRTRPDGITAIVPFQNVRHYPQTDNFLKNTIPPAPFMFDKRERNTLPYCLRGYIPHLTVLDKPLNNGMRKVALGFLMFEITDTTSGFVYVPTSPCQLSEIENDISEKFCDFKRYKHHIINAATAYITTQKEKIGSRAVEHLKDFIKNMDSVDFTFDFLLLPSVFRDYNIDMEYYRPNSKLYGLNFNNVNSAQIQHQVKSSILKQVEKIISQDLPHSNSCTFSGIDMTSTFIARDRKTKGKIRGNTDYPFIREIQKLRLAIR